MKKAGVSFPTVVETGTKRTLKRKEVAQTMGFRKRAMTMMIQAKVDYDCREYLIGHKRSRGLNVSYDRTSEEDRFIEWSKAINLLTVDPKLRLEIKIQKLETDQAQEIVRLKTQIDKMKENNRSEVLALKTQCDEINEKLSRIDLVDLQSFPLESFPSEYTIHNLLAEYGFDDKRQNLMKKNMKDD
jgi:hypothetical protein